MRRACCASTSGMSIPRGSATALRTADFVISLYVTRLNGFLPAAGSSTSCRCHAIASPSRSGSLARYISSADLTADLSSETTFSLPSETTYFGVKVHLPSPALSMRIAPFSFGRSRMCPTELLTTKSPPRYLPIVFAFAGDSTIRSFFPIAV